MSDRGYRDRGKSHLFVVTSSSSRASVFWKKCSSLQQVDLPFLFVVSCFCVYRDKYL